MTVLGIAGSPPDSPPSRFYTRPCRSMGFTLARNAARQWREEAPLLRKRWRLILLCTSMQYMHAIAGQVCPRHNACDAQRDPQGAARRAWGRAAAPRN